ncbi:hypothetical protein AWC17_21760 [Mycobacterium nebraskense]|uniref:Uncharacterized protein n=1 Tax=Mycobacterium nebraskense TaxID=244292 RepID=A0A1X2A2C6_9MYCO|nr:hypothetical protein WU83_05125 [Mycobacterium nebraskense]ORW35614.1 hypothetical protein AWC17_21760 [Mycobacterium nebraskense]
MPSGAKRDPCSGHSHAVEFVVGHDAMIPAHAPVGLKIARPWHLMDSIVVLGSDFDPATNRTRRVRQLNDVQHQ